MKIRIKGNSIRFRLTKSEVYTLCTEKYLVEKTHFAQQTFAYEVVVKSIENLDAQFENNTITLFFPEKETLTWFDSNLITYKNSIQLPNGESLSLLIEKDFICLDHSDEDQSDNYPNPNKTC